MKLLTRFPFQFKRSDEYFVDNVNFYFDFLKNEVKKKKKLKND